MIHSPKSLLCCPSTSRSTVSLCVTWRQALRHRPAAGVWNKSILLTDTRQRFSLEGPLSVFLDLALDNSQLAERITAVSNWLRQRASGFYSVAFGRHSRGLQLDDPQKVDCFDQLVNALGQAHSPPAVHVHVKGGACAQAGCQLTSHFINLCLP